MSVITTADFVGKYAIPTNPQTVAILSATIAEVENEYLPDLFGVVLYDLFILSLATPEARFTKVMDPLSYQDSNEVIHKSEGIKQMLINIVYCIYLRDVDLTPGVSGFTKIKSENSENISMLNSGVYLKYNKGIDTYKEIQHYMNSEDSATYPEFKGKDQEYITPY